MTRQKSRNRDPSVTSRMMSKVKHKDSKAEIAVRRRLHAQEFRYRTHYSKLYGHPDIVFTRNRIAIFIDGDFWHGNAWKLRGLSSLAEMFPNRTEWWVTKIERNMVRDAEVNSQLEASGWTVLRFWESDILRDPGAIVEQIVANLKG